MYHTIPVQHYYTHNNNNTYVHGWIHGLFSETTLATYLQKQELDNSDSMQ